MVILHVKILSSCGGDEGRAGDGGGGGWRGEAACNGVGGSFGDGSRETMTYWRVLVMGTVKGMVVVWAVHNLLIMGVARSVVVRSDHD